MPSFPELLRVWRYTEDQDQSEAMDLNRHDKQPIQLV